MMKNIDVLKLSILIRQFCGQLFDVIDVIWKNEKYVQQPDRFFYTIFMKVITILDAVHILIYNLDHKPHYAITTGLLLRTCLLDIVNLYYILDVLEDEPQMMERINALMSDHLKYIYRDLKPVEQAQIRKDWPELFNIDDTLKKYALPNSGKMVEEITNFPSIRKEAKGAQELYAIFSKYEHNGAFTFDLLHNPYSVKGSEIVKVKIKEAVDSCVIALKTISGHWISDQDPLSLAMGLTVKEILSL